jgi:hypothetical protein
MNCLRLLERWDRGFESHSRHGYLNCTRLLYVCVVLCIGDWSPFKELYRLCIGSGNWKSGQGPTKGCRAIIIINIKTIFFKTDQSHKIFRKKYISSTVLALTSLISGGRSVGIVRLRTMATEFSFSSYCLWRQEITAFTPELRPGKGLLELTVAHMGFDYLSMKNINIMAFKDETSWILVWRIPPFRRNTLHASSGFKKWIRWRRQIPPKNW